MLVEIYIDTDTRATKPKKAHYAAIVVAKARSGDEERMSISFEEESTYNRATLLAALAGMEILTRPCEIMIFTANQWFVTNVNSGNVEKWKRSEWKRAQNKELKNKDLWELLEMQMGKHKVTIVHTKESPYFEKIKTILEKHKNEEEE